MYKPKKFTNKIETEQGVCISVVAEENIKTDWNKPYSDPEREQPDGTYSLTVDLSESDAKKFRDGITVKLPCGGVVEFGLKCGWIEFKDEYTGDKFYIEYKKEQDGK